MYQGNPNSDELNELLEALTDSLGSLAFAFDGFDFIINDTPLDDLGSLYGFERIAVRGGIVVAFEQFRQEVEKNLVRNNDAASEAPDWHLVEHHFRDAASEYDQYMSYPPLE